MAPTGSTRNAVSGSDISQIITGIGLSVVDLALEAKAKHIIIADLRLTSEATALVETHESVVFQQCDVSNWHDLQKLIDVSKERLHDVPDVYVANAGVFEPVSSP